MAKPGQMRGRGAHAAREGGHFCHRVDATQRVGHVSDGDQLLKQTTVLDEVSSRPWGTESPAEAHGRIPKAADKRMLHGRTDGRTDAPSFVG